MLAQIQREIAEDPYYRNNFDNDGQRFIAWYLRRVLLRDDAQTRDDITDGPNDKEIDAVIVDEEEQRIVVIQGKFITAGQVDGGPIQEVLTAWLRIQKLDSLQKDCNERLKKAKPIHWGRCEMRRRTRRALSAAGPMMSLLVVGALVMACSKSTTGPTDARAPTGVVEAAAPARTFSVFGTVFEHTVTNTRPLAGLHFTVGFPNRVQVDVVSDANGRYEAAGFPDGISILLSVSPDQNYRAPCPVPIALLKSNTLLDLHVVSNATLIASGLPASLPTPSNLPHVLGTVFEIASGQLRPAGGADVSLLGWDGYSSSSTLSGPDGRYLVCLPWDNEITQTLRATKQGYQPNVQSVVLYSWDQQLDFELRR